MQLHSLKHDSVELAIEHDFSQCSPLNPIVQLQIPLMESHENVLFRTQEQFVAQFCPKVHSSHFCLHLVEERQLSEDFKPI